MKRIKRLIPIFVLILLMMTKVEAYTGTTAIHENPKATERGNYITLKHTVDVASSDISITYSYDNKFLQLIGFIPTSNGTCILEGNKIKCQNIQPTNVFVYPVFKITADLTANKDISATFYDIEQQNTTKITVRKIEKIIQSTSIDIKEISKELIVGDTYQIEASISPANANNKTITYKSSNEEIATVDENGLVTAKAQGLVYITLTNTSLRSVVEINVLEKEIKLEKIKSKSKIELKTGEEEYFEVTFEPNDTTIDISNIKYSTSDKKVAIVNSDGEIVAIGVGEATITASIDDKTTTTKVVVTASAGTENKEEKSTSAVVPCIITAAVTFIATLVISFVIKTKKNKQENGSDEDEKNDYTSFTI